MSTLINVEDRDDGGRNLYVVPDGFRPRKKRPKGWEAKAMAAGIIRDPNAPEPSPRARKPGDVVIEMPVATLRGDATIPEE